jgi:proteasome lid subunit RPN8/RPN11
LPESIFAVLSKRLAEIRLESGARATMVGAAQALRTHECCGALIGRTGTAGDSEVLEAWPLPNRAEDTAHEYLIPADAVRAVEALARARDMDVLGFYHSHPDGSTLPSATDLERAWPGYLYAVIDASAGAVRFWRLEEDRSAFSPIESCEP